MAEQRFCVEYAKRGTAGCKKCKDKIMKGLVRIGKVVPNPFTESGGDMKEWYHVKCIFEKFEKARATTKKIEDITDLEGWEELQDEEKELINKHISDLAAKAAASPKKKVQAKLSPGGQLTSPSTQLTSPSPRKFSGFSATKPGPSSPAPATQGSKLSAQYCDPTHKDCLFREFHGFHGDLFLTVKLLLPGVIKSVYNLNDKQIVKLFSRIFNCNQEEMKAAFQDAKVCLFVFDCIFFNGVSLMDRPLRERKKFLHENMVEIPNRILFSEMKHVTRAADLADMITRVIREGLEGLVLKDVKGLYEPGKRHWLKVKKDYLNEGAMADTADLVVLGAFYGTGSKGGMMSVFLMGCYDPASQMWCTVTKCAGGHDDATLARLQSELDMVKISKEPSKIPGWLKINKNYYPDFVARDPKKAAVWEITGAEFSKAEAHTADGISIRFPRCTRIRDDKDWQSATNLPQLRELFRLSKETSDFEVTAGPSKSSSGGESVSSTPPSTSTASSSKLTAASPKKEQN
ncbi:DNA ligase 3 [Acipenser ruthenus]|uniref:DNA ligase 3 n=1 Tax=Acipenser ruthenus TaxID=7906 RepID=A0A662YTE9_ACIRT|nr:DNA ligase 3 [Acipenser ruthenus]